MRFNNEDTVCFRLGGSKDIDQDFRDRDNGSVVSRLVCGALFLL